MIGHWFTLLLVPAAAAPDAPAWQPMAPGPDDYSSPPQQPGYNDDESLLQLAVALIMTGALNG